MAELFFSLSNIFKFQSAPWWLPIERVFWRQVKYFFIIVIFLNFWHLSQHALCWSFPLMTPKLLSPQDLVQASGSGWTSRWFRWAGTMLRPFVAGRVRGCPQRRSGSGLHVAGCKVHGIYDLISYDTWNQLVHLCHHLDWYTILASMKQIDIDTSGDPRTNTLELLLISWTCWEQQFRLCLFWLSFIPGRTYPWGNKFQANRSNLWQVSLL